jgi:hypothetical protein
MLLTVAMVEGSTISRGAGGAVLAAWVLPVWNVESWSVVRCIVQYVVSIGNVFCPRSSSQCHNSKRTAVHAPKQCLPSVRPKLSATNNTGIKLFNNLPPTIKNLNHGTKFLSLMDIFM